MIVFDTLDELESYKGAFSCIDTVIEVMDHSTPYDETQGEYPNPGKDKGVHIIDTFLTSQNGFMTTLDSNKTYLEICLEGEEIVSIDSSVFKLSPGRFLLYSGYESVKRGLMYSLPIATKCVRFVF